MQAELEAQLADLSTAAALCAAAQRRAAAAEQQAEQMQRQVEGLQQLMQQRAADHASLQVRTGSVGFGLWQ